MKNTIALIAGMIFSIGLIISGMINPQKVIGFLDIFGSWNPALAFVMGGAVIINILLFRIILKNKPLLTQKHSLPIKQNIDKSLLLGSAFFGVGWGLSGICPGPAIVNLIKLELTPFIFVLSMLAGMGLFKIGSKKAD